MKKRLTFQRIYGTNVRHIASDNKPFILNVSKRIIKPNAITPINKIRYPKISTLAIEKNIPSLSMSFVYFTHNYCKYRQHP